MKKLLVLMIIAMAFVLPQVALADWQVTAHSWTMSPGPDLAYEQVLQDDVVINIANGFPVDCDNILPGDSKSCAWIIGTKSGQVIKIRSFDTSDNAAPDHILGTIDPGPNPASGGSITVIWQ